MNITIKALITETKRWWNEYVFMKRLEFRLKMEIKMADVKHKITNKQYIVIPDPYSKYNITNLCVDQIQSLKKQGRIKKHDGKYELTRKAFYLTPLTRNSSALPFEERQRMAQNFQNFLYAVSPFKRDSQR